jgi:hypothetical protein
LLGVCHNFLFQHAGPQQTDPANGGSVTYHRCRRPFSVAIVSLLLLSSAAVSQDKDFTHWGRSINIGPNDEATDVTCFGCSIHIRGQVSGDVTAFLGSITIENEAQVAGDVTAFCGDMRLVDSARVDGDATVFGGHLHRDPNFEVGGTASSMGSRAVVLLIAMVPVVLLGLLVPGLIWLIRRLRRPPVPAAAP